MISTLILSVKIIVEANVSRELLLNSWVYIES